MFHYFCLEGVNLVKHQQRAVAKLMAVFICVDYISPALSGDGCSLYKVVLLFMHVLGILILTDIFSTSYFEFQTIGNIMCVLLQGNISAFVSFMITC